MSKIYVGDTGTVITLRTGQSLADASALSILVRKPDASETSWPATADISDGVVHISTDQTFDLPGVYLLQAQVEYGSGIWLGETTKLKVYRPFS